MKTASDAAFTKLVFDRPQRAIAISASYLGKGLARAVLFWSTAGGNQ